VHLHFGECVLRRTGYGETEPRESEDGDHDHTADGELGHPVTLHNIRLMHHVGWQPELLSGTLRQNLDPFGQHDDATLNEALRAAGLFSLQSSETEGSEDMVARLNLDSNIASGGGNVSVGQRQVLSLARALVRQSKLLILDEATSAIGKMVWAICSVAYTHVLCSLDHATDTVIQASLRGKLPKDTSVLIVAHRLQTIMDADKIVRAFLCLLVSHGVADHEYG
jgi:ABC-type bacteriocin/lantibiotic exporter with double-glycine peptidase domain